MVTRLFIGGHMQGTETEPAATARAGLRHDLRQLTPTLTVLVGSLVVAAIGVYQLCGFGLHSLDRRPHLFSDGLATGGVIVAAVAAGAAVGNLAWTLTAARRGTGDTGGSGNAGKPAATATPGGAGGSAGAE